MLKISFTLIGVSLLLSTIIFNSACAKRDEKLRPSADIIGQEVVCPVMGNKFKITENTPVIEYNGEKYYFCCSGCDKDFAKDPDKYIKNLEQTPQSENKNKEIIYWTCSMHPEVKADENGKCPICSMALTPVYEKTGSDGSLYLSEDEILLAGVRLASANKNELFKEIQTIGQVAYDPDLVIAQEEYINAINMMTSLDEADEITAERAKNIVERSKYKLKLLGMSDSEIKNLKIAKHVDKSLIMPEENTWIYAELYESDIPWVKKGQSVTVLSTAYPDKGFEGRIISVNPTVDDITRSVQVRIILSNTKLLLKPGMYVDVIIKSRYYLSDDKENKRIITVPKAAVLDTGNSKLVWIYTGNGNFEPRQVITGPAGIVQIGNSFIQSYPILEGIKENEVIVTNGNFLIDSEYQITGSAALGYSGAIGIEASTPTSDNENQ